MEPAVQCSLSRLDYQNFSNDDFFQGEGPIGLLFVVLTDCLVNEIFLCFSLQVLYVIFTLWCYRFPLVTTKAFYQPLRLVIEYMKMHVAPFTLHPSTFRPIPGKSHISYIVKVFLILLPCFSILSSKDLKHSQTED